VASAIVLAIGLERTRRPSGDVADVVVELVRARRGALRDALSRLLGDPGLELGNWSQTRMAYLTADGVPVSLPAAGSRMVATPVDMDDQPIALIVHDASLLDDPGSLQAITTATRLAAQHDRLQEALRSQLAELEASRQRLVSAEIDARRDLEGQLQTGAARRIEALRRSLADAEAATSRTDVATLAAIGRAHRQAEATIDEIGTLARGLHPREPIELGLGDALAALAKRSGLPVRVSVDADGVDADTAVLAWFVCSEALANASRHADAETVSMTVRKDGGQLLIDVEDDGNGDVDITRGTGLRGIADRVESSGGTFSVVGRSGIGTTVRAAVPLH
jgi:signal transduction histidine kinase